MSDNSKKEKQRPGRDARRSRGEKRKHRKTGRKMRWAEYGSACWRIRINKPLY
jgi:hypothetical protein